MVVDGGEVHRADDLHEQDEASQGAQHHIRLNLREKLFHIKVPAVLRIRIRCLFDLWIRDPGWVKNQDPDFG